MTCTHCAKDACFSCQQPWHEGRGCRDIHQAGYQFYMFRTDVRPCPNCGVRIEKFEGCPEMYCIRCKTGFCWSCMNSPCANENRYLCGCAPIPMCPMIPLSMCANLLITLAAIILCPLVMVLFPIGVALYMGFYQVPYEINRSFKYSYSCTVRFFGCLLGIAVGWLLALPLFIVLALLVGALASTIGTVCFWFCCICYLTILTKNALK